jgi:hypothetical protein
MRPTRILTGMAILTATALILSDPPRTEAADKPRPTQEVLDGSPPAYSRQFLPRHPAPNPVLKTRGNFTETDWAALIDATWGPGLSQPDDIALWTEFWTHVDNTFPCFPGLDTNVWSDVWDRYYPEILDTVSRGRLCAMTLHGSRALRESHTYTEDQGVVQTQMTPGVPLMHVGAWGVNDHFGAGLTVMPDSSLLVYKVVDNHPLGLVPGDLVLGYDGTPWKEIYPELLAAELPLTGYWWGSNEYSYEYSFLVCAGQNWHLFDTIDVVKYGTGDTLHLGTDALVGQDMTLWATEQMDIPGVELPDTRIGEVVSWGVVEGTRTGYIYSTGWFPSDNAGIVNAQWQTALDSLENHYDVTGLILDFRTNYGATFSFAPTLARFFDSTFLPTGVHIRCGDHFDLCDYSGLDYLFHIFGAGTPAWDGPIAILTGPGAVSGGDFYPMILSKHELAKVFGRPSSSAFNAVSGYSLPQPGWNHRISVLSAFLTGDPNHHITRDPFPDDPVHFPWVDYEEVWLTPEGVAEGRDDVVETAMAWLLGRDYDQDGYVNEYDNCQALPTPGNDPVTTGDVNIDGDISSGDIIWLVNFTFKSGSPPLPIAEAGDADCSGSVTSGDIIFLVNHVFKSGLAPCDVCAIP